ncbi:MAG: hypothetical protein AAF430_08975 [Myxococcota bacterium]
MTDTEFLAAFESAAISSDDWTHRDHIRMAFLYLRDLPWDTALEQIRTGIQRLNRANRVEETAVSGYHETVTVAWARVIAAQLHHHGPGEHFDTFAAANPHLLTKTLLRLYYTRAQILTPEAKAGFVAPDLAPLPDAPAA